MSVDPEKYDDETKKKLADTNMENYGGKEHRDKQRSLAEKQKEWKDVKAKGEGVMVWRIEKFRVIPWPEDQYGDFFSGDSFIVLNGYKEGNSEDMKYNVHFWLGEKTSQDEAGTAAIKTVELDDLLGDVPVQYREVQGHESKHFMSLFAEMNILEGGVDSGFRHVEPEKYEPRLIHVTGKPKKMRNYQVPLHTDSLNNCDAFLLDTGACIYQFRPSKCSVWEKQASNKLANEIYDSRHGKSKKVSPIGFDDKSPDAEAFWNFFGGKPDSLPDESPFALSKKKEEEGYANHVNKMFHVTDEDGKMSCKEIQSGKLDKAILKEEDDDVLIIDVGRVVFVWIGSSANKEEIKHAMIRATEYLRDNGRPMWTPVERVMSGREPKHFWNIFGVEHYQG